jgi:hypothetical protein
MKELAVAANETPLHDTELPFNDPAPASTFIVNGAVNVT